MGSSCSTASVYIQMDEIVAMARSRRIEEALSKEEVITIRLIRAIIRVVLINSYASEKAPPYFHKVGYEKLFVRHEISHEFGWKTFN